jgi:hypothetical protein
MFFWNPNISIYFVDIQKFLNLGDLNFMGFYTNGLSEIYV